MKAIKDGKIFTIKEAVEYTLTPNAYTYSGKIERIEKIVEMQSEMIAKIVQGLSERNNTFSGKFADHELEELLEYGFTIEEE